MEKAKRERAFVIKKLKMNKNVRKWLNNSCLTWNGSTVENLWGIWLRFGDIDEGNQFCCSFYKKLTRIKHFSGVFLRFHFQEISRNGKSIAISFFQESYSIFLFDDFYENSLEKLFIFVTWKTNCQVEYASKAHFKGTIYSFFVRTSGR